MEYDIAVIGGGITGLSQSLALAKLGYEVVLIDANSLQPKALSQEYGLRVYAINHASKALFHYLNVWDDIIKQRYAPYDSMFVWDPISKGEIKFDNEHIPQDDLGYIIEEQVIKKSLLDKIQTQTNIHCLPEQVVEAVINFDEIVQIKTHNKTIKAKLLLGCDGANSKIRSLLDFSLTSRSYNHHAIVCNVSHQKSHTHCARQIFTPDGPLAFLPLDDLHHSSIVWSINPNKAQELMMMEDAAFKGALAFAFEHKLGEILTLSKRIQFPLTMRHVDNYVIKNTALIGDAAHTIHPLAGQGVNLGLLDVAILTQSIIDAKNPLCHATLRRYERATKAHNILMIAAMEGFKQLFSKNSLMPDTLKALGMQLTDKLTPLKTALMQQAMGLKGELPPILKENIS